MFNRHIAWDFMVVLSLMAAGALVGITVQTVTENSPCECEAEEVVIEKPVPITSQAFSMKCYFVSEESE